MSSERSNAEKYNASRFKRMVDILVGTLGLPPTIVAIALVGLATKLEDGGDVFFKQERIGKDGKTFEMYKLRTFNSRGERTKVGKVVRPLAIDELPQVLNILLGDMSIFGIRALSKADFDNLSSIYANDPHFDEAFLQKWKETYCSARPGGLSLAVARAKSIFYRGYNNSAGVRKKMEYDIEQVENASFAMEMKILLTIVSRALGSVITAVSNTYME